MGQHARWTLLFHRFSVKSQPDLKLWGVNMSQTENSLVPFASRDKGNGGDQLDKAGQSILNLLQEAAGVAEKNSRHALESYRRILVTCGVRRQLFETAI